MSWHQIKIKMKFTTPAFLGGADKSAELRVPPFKHLIRFWWRVAVGHKYEYDHKKIREIEGRIFGNAWLKENNKLKAERSRILIRIGEWVQPDTNNTGWPEFDTVYDQEVRQFNDGNINPALYLGYGPVSNHGPNLTYIPSGTTFVLSLINNPIDPVSDSDFPVTDVLKLIHWFGAVGSRSRNGWGSLRITGVIYDQPQSKTANWNLEPKNLDTLDVTKDFKDVMNSKKQWSHVIGKDKTPLVWEGESFNDWTYVVHDLAELKIAFRTDLGFHGRDMLESRHMLAYPVGHHNALGPNERLANQILFKIAESNKNYYGIVVHLPHVFPDDLFNLARKIVPANLNTPAEQINIWQKVHGIIDASRKFRRLP